MKRYLVIGAHPDDCEAVGGIALRLKQLGRQVRFLSATNGCSGHQSQMGGALAARRAQEARRVTEVSGIEYQILDLGDGELTTGLPERRLMIQAIREFDPDVVITHRPNDYHPDHRATSILVQDSAFLVQVPNICPLTPVMRRMPAVFYMGDEFTKPQPFSPDLVFDITGQMEGKLLLYHQHTSQMYEWLPWVGQSLKEDIPEEDGPRLAWLRGTRFEGRSRDCAERWRAQLVAKYGEAGRQARFAEALEACEYGARPSPEELKELFPF